MKKIVQFLFYLLFTESVFGQIDVQPNIIFIISDDLNDYIEPLGEHPDVETPNINRLAEKGTTFFNAYASSPLCAPSRTSMLSGKDAHYTQVYGNHDYKCGAFSSNFTSAENNEEYFTIPQYLKDSAGYFTYNINKIFHCQDNYMEYDGETPDPCAKTLAWNKYILYSDTIILNPIEEANNEGVGAYKFGRLNDSLEHIMMDYVATDSAIKFIDDYSNDASAFCNKPFFIALGLHEPHKDQFVPEKYFSEYYLDDIYAEPFNFPYNFPKNSYPQNGIIPSPQPEIPWSDLYALPENGVARTMVKNVDTSFMNWANNLDVLPVINPDYDDSVRRDILTWSKRANALMAYLAAVKYIDAQVGRLLDDLESHPELLNNTIIIFIGDHGHSLGEKKHWGKNAMWETDIRTSLIIADLRNPISLTTNRTVSLIDLFPTICDYLHIPQPVFSNGDVYPDGKSLLPLMQNPDLTWERPVLSSLKKDPGNEASCDPQYSIRDERFHYILYKSNGGGADICDPAASENEEELYEIGIAREVDPYEWNNLINDESYRPLIQYLQQYLPDSGLYLQKTFKAEIENNVLDCYAEFDDTLQLFINLFDPEGNSIIPSPDFNYKWTNNLTNDIFEGTEINFPISLIDESVFDDHDRMMIDLQVYDSTEKLIAFDTRYFYINPLNEPVASFNLITSDENTILTTDFAIEGNYNSYWWDFGYGPQFYDQIPGPYTVPAPGDYTVTLYVQYGNENCIKAFSENISTTTHNYLDGSLLVVYPNPSKFDLNVYAKEGDLYGDFQIYNLYGQSILFFSNRDPNLVQLSFNIQSLSAGFYFIQFKNSVTPFVVLP